MQHPVLSAVLELEWEMFFRVDNAGGPASCQSDPETFGIMRESQLRDWPEALLQSYLADLKAARGEGRNLMAEKYAWMMRTTFPREFEKLQADLPKPSPGALVLIEEIVALNLAWKQETQSRYPRLDARGRPVRTAEDTPWATSFETYLRGELTTYSQATLQLLRDHCLALKSKGRNGVALALEHQVRRYGHASLEAAERSM